MKRLCSIIMVLLLCLAMAVPVFAVAPEEYVFELLPSISMLDSFRFDLDGRSFFYEGYLPAGSYDVKWVYNCGDSRGEVSYCSLSPAVVLYDSLYEGYPCSSFTVAFDGVLTESLDFIVVDGFASIGVTILALYESLPDDHVYAYFVFTPVNGDFSLADYFNADTLAATLDHLIALLPVILAVIVGYIGLRKAIAWLMSVMRSS